MEFEDKDGQKTHCLHLLVYRSLYLNFCWKWRLHMISTHKVRAEFTIIAYSDWKRKYNHIQQNLCLRRTFGLKYTPSSCRYWNYPNTRKFESAQASNRKVWQCDVQQSASLKTNGRLVTDLPLPRHPNPLAVSNYLLRFVDHLDICKVSHPWRAAKRPVAVWASLSIESSCLLHINLRRGTAWGRNALQIIGGLCKGVRFHLYEDGNRAP